MPTRSLNVVITGDSRGIGLAARETEGHFRAIQRSAKITGAAVKGAFGLAAAGTLIGVGALKKSVDAAKEAETSHARLTAQLKASGISYHAHAKQIDNVIQKHSQLAGIDDEDLQDAFTSLVRSTGSVSKSMKDMGLVTDIARAKHIDVGKAADLLGKVHAGNTGILKRYGIAIDPVTKAQDKLKESGKKATVEQVKAAKAADSTATSQKALGELQKRFGGQAEAYGKTAAGAQERFGVAVENVEEKLGAKLLPAITKVVGGVATFVSQMDSGRGAGGRFASAVSDGFNAAKNAVKTAVNAIKGFLHDNREDIQSVGRAIKNVATAAKAVIENVLIPAFKILLPAVKGVVDGMLTSLKGLIRFVTGVLTGDWRKAWQGIKDIVGGELHAIVSLVKGAGKLLLAAAEGAGKALAKGIVSGLGSIGHMLLQKIKDAWDWVKSHIHLPSIKLPFGLGSVGDGLGAGSLPGLGGGGSLMGADPDLQPFASLASGMGLHTSSGLRVGATTISGNSSYHSSGDAIDEAGPFGAMKRYAGTLFHTSGGTLRELISPFPQFNIKDGHPYRYPANIQAQHSGSNAHVHVAYTGPFGDGIGFRGLEDLWVRAGGGRKIAPLMAHIAQAESVGNPRAHNPSGASGLWQILGQPFRGNVYDPLTNAKMAVWKYQHQGLGAWAASRGTWGRYVGSGETYGGSGGGGGTRVKHGSSVVHFGAHQPTAGTPSEDIYDFLHPRPLKGGGPSKGFLEGQRPPTPDDGVDANTAAIEENNRLLAAQNDLNQTIAANQLKLISIAGQGDQIVNAVIATVNSGLGRSIGLGQAGLRSPAGAVTRQ